MLVSLTFLRISLPELPGKRFCQSLRTYEKAIVLQFTAVTSSEVLRLSAKMYSEHSLQLKRSLLQEKFRVTTFLIINVCSKTLVLLVSERSNIYEKKQG